MCSALNDVSMPRGGWIHNSQCPKPAEHGTSASRRSERFVLFHGTQKLKFRTSDHRCWGQKNCRCEAGIRPPLPSLIGAQRTLATDCAIPSATTSPTSPKSVNPEVLLISRFLAVALLIWPCKDLHCVSAAQQGSKAQSTLNLCRRGSAVVGLFVVLQWISGTELGAFGMGLASPQNWNRPGDPESQLVRTHLRDDFPRPSALRVPDSQAI